MQAVQDIRYAVRQLRKTPAFAATAVLSIALGIGAATAIFSVVHGVILDPFPYKDVDSLMSIKIQEPGQRGFRTYYTVDQFVEFKDKASSLFSGITVSTIDDVAWTGRPDPQRLRGNHTTFDGLEIMGVPAITGRIFTAADDAASANPVCVLGYRFWQKQFAGDPSVVGKTMLLNGKTRTVIGVMPPRFMWRGADVYLPMHFRQGVQEEGVHFVHVLGRVKPGVTEAQVDATLRPVVDELRRRTPSEFPEKFRVGLLSFADTFPSDIKESLLLLFGAVGLLLLIACANVSSLLLTRGMAREREIAVRASLGASRGRLISQLLTESLVIGTIGGLLGVVFAYAGMRGILTLVPPYTIPDESDTRINLAVLGFSCLTTIVTALFFGLFPAWQASRTNLASGLKDSERGSVSRKQSFVRSALVVIEVALAVILMVSAGLMVRTMIAVQNVSLGVNTAGLLSFRIPFDPARYPKNDRRALVVEDLLDRLSHTPGVLSAAANTWFHPLGNFSAPVRISGAAEPDSRNVEIHSVSKAYLETYGIPLVRGRGLSEVDLNSHRRVALVSERFVKRYLAKGEALGAVVSIPRLAKPPFSIPAQDFEVIGVVGDTLAGNIRESTPELYVPHTLAGVSDCITVRTAVPDPFSLLGPVRAAVSAIDKDQPISDVKTIEARLAEGYFASRQFNALLFGIFAVLGLTLAMIGIYGVMTNSVVRRTREIGVRMALGATFSSVVKMVLREGAALLTVGIVIGLIGCIFTGRMLERLIWNVQPFDPFSIAAVALLLAGLGLLACFLPAQRAARVDPLHALRQD